MQDPRFPAFPVPGSAPIPGYENPHGFLPHSAPTMLPEQIWTAKVGMLWEGVAAANGRTNDTETGRYSQWATPVFDLRPELGGVPADVPVQGGAYQLNRPGQLVIMVTFNAAPALLDSLNIATWDEANPFDPNDMRPVTSEQDVTMAITTGTAPYGLGPYNQGISGLIFAAPPQGPLGYIRYWRFRMIMRLFVQQADPIVTISAAWY